MKVTVCISTLLLALLAIFSASGAQGSPKLDRAFGQKGKVALPTFTNDYPGHSYGISAAAARRGRLTVVDSLGGVAQVGRSGNVSAGFGYGHGSDQSSVSFGTVDLKAASHGGLVGLSSWGSRSKASSYLYRLTRKGKINRSFGTKGKVVLAFGKSSARDIAEFVALDVDSHGRYVVAGRGPHGRFFVVRRYLAYGQIDRSFGVNGTWRGRIGWSGGGASISDLKTVGDTVIVAGRTPSREVVFKLDSEGRIDRAFAHRSRNLGTCGPGGCRTNFACSKLCLDSKLVRLSDGTLLLLRFQASKETRWENTISRFRPDGSPVKSFGAHGVILLTDRTTREISPDTKNLGKLSGLFGGATPLGRHGFVLATYATIGGQGMRSIGIAFSGSGKAIRGAAHGLAYSLPLPEGSWGMYPNGKTGFFVTGRSGKKPMRKDSQAVFRFLSR